MYESAITKHCKRLNKFIKDAHDNKESIWIPKSDFSSLRIVAYSDEAFANNADLPSQLGRIVLPTDVANNAVPVLRKSYKSRLIALTVLSAEIIAFLTYFYDALAIR